MTPTSSTGRLLPNVKIDLHGRYSDLLSVALSRVPRNLPPIVTLTLIREAKRGRQGFAGLTTYSGARGASYPSGRQKITFYSSMLDRLPDPAALAVIVHELAHAWLNEHVKPEESDVRETEADDVARRWGFGAELDALSREVE